MATRMPEVSVEIQSKQPANDNDGVIEEWERSLIGNESTKLRQHHRRIEKLPPLLRKGEKGQRNQEHYEPDVVSLGPYHHNQLDLAQAENFKLITLEEFSSNSKKKIDYLYNRVLEVVHEARKCYIDGSTDNYTDEEFNRMMPHDACFVLFSIECFSLGNKKILLLYEYLGTLASSKVVRDIFLLENRIPFLVLEVLLDLRYEDKGEKILNGFFNYLNYGEMNWTEEKVLEGEHPLHLLELYRSYFISFSSRWLEGSKKDDVEDDYNYVKRNRWYSSVMGLKAKGIFVKCRYDKSTNEGIKFNSGRFYGELELVRRAVTSNSKPIYLNMIAYEMCPHNPNDFRVSTYIRVMKSLIVHPDDVKELRNNGILIHSLGQDEVVKIYDEIEITAGNIYMFNPLQRGIEHHCKKV